jgi:hypothetical protein
MENKTPQKPTKTQIPDDLKKRFDEIEEGLKNHAVDVNQLYSWYKEEILRKEAEIKKLRNDNDVLFKTAIKAKESLIHAKDLMQHTRHKK